MARRVVFVRVGWMRFYGAASRADELVGGGTYNIDNTGAEERNFRRYPDGSCYGFYQPPGGASGFNLQRIETGATGETLENVLVIQVATDPQVGGQRIVGWYDAATCLRTMEDKPHLHTFRAACDSCTLLPADARQDGPRVPKGKGGFGQANVCYQPIGAPIEPWMEEAVTFATNYTGLNALDDPLAAVRSKDATEVREKLRSRGQGFRLDADERLAIELHAMALAESYYTGLGWTVRDVSARASYDLECTRGAEELRVEVKGMTGGGESILITPNEAQHAEDYKDRIALFVVHGIDLQRRPSHEPKTSGGVVREINPWVIGDCDLRPVGFECVLPVANLSR